MQSRHRVIPERIGLIVLKESDRSQTGTLAFLNEPD